MKPTHGKRAGQYTRPAEEPKSAARQFVELNTHQNITMKRKFMYQEDIPTAININTLEERIKLKKWLQTQLQKSHSTDDLITLLTDSIDKDRHRLQKGFKITLK